ncbi:MAG TPA: helix-turn-helix transcriptional regulator [Solirubrobacteraceae bacterium]|nr:helix-turn-helix transcriptional regulator [Solirubrobacteraceae bacterium]
MAAEQRSPTMAARSQTHAALGRAVRDLRAARGVSQEDLAHLSGMHRTYVGGIERGERNVSYENLKRLAQALEVPASQLLARAEQHEGSA